MKQKNFTIRLLSMLRPYIGKVILLFFLIIFSSVLNIIPPFLLQFALDNYLLKYDLFGLSFIGIAIIGFGAILGLQNFMQRTTSQFLGQRMVKDLRDKLFSHYNHLSFSFFDKNSTGDAVSRLIADTEQLNRFLSKGFLEFITNFLILIGTMVVLFFWNVQFGLIVVFIYPFIFFGMNIYSKRVYPANLRARKANSSLTSAIQETLNGMREVKLYAREEYIEKIFQKWNEEYFDAMIGASRYNALWGPYVPFILNIASTTLIFIGANLVIDGAMTVGLLVAAIAYFNLITKPIQTIMGYVTIHNTAKAASERVFSILDQIPDIKDRKNAQLLENVIGTIEYSHVSFGYDPSKIILKDISFKVNPGELIAIIGPSGVGKTTLVHLLPRFYDIIDGTITIDGIDIRDIQLKSLRKNIGIVMQNVFLFNGTIADNIKYGKEDATMEEIENAAKIAQLHNFICSLPAGYNTEIGERGVKLSGGQAQRISIARVIITNPKILILDEPTANVDAITDSELMKAVRAVLKGRTTLIIAHRFWTVKNADRLILLKEGRVEAIGSHEALMKSSQFYRDFFASQFREQEKQDAGQEDQQKEGQ